MGTARQSTYSRTTITSTSRDEQTQKSKETENDSITHDKQKIPSRPSDEECCEHHCQEVVYDEGAVDSPVNEGRKDTEEKEANCNEDHSCEEFSQDCNCQEVIFVEDGDGSTVQQSKEVLSVEDSDDSTVEDVEENKIVGSFESQSISI